MRVAVVTSTIAGRELMFEECKASVQAQTYPVKHLFGDGTGRPEAHVLNELIGPADCDAYLVLNDDDLLLPTCVEKCVERLDGFDIVYPWARVEGRDYAFDVTGLGSHGDVPITSLIRKDVFTRLDGYRAYQDGVSGIGADGDFYKRAVRDGVSFTYVPERLWVYRFHGDNMSMKPRS